MDRVDLDHGKVLAVTAALFVALATLLFEDDNFLVLLVFENGGLHTGTLNEGIAKACVGTFTDHEDIIDVDRITGSCAGKRVDLQDVAFRDGKLAALCFDCGFHGKNA